MENEEEGDQEQRGRGDTRGEEGLAGGSNGTTRENGNQVGQNGTARNVLTRNYIIK